MKTIGIVGAGPAGLYVTQRLSKMPGIQKIVVWEKEALPGGRTKMGEVEGRQVVGGAGVVRDKDKRLKSLAKSLLTPFTSQYHIGWTTPSPDQNHGLKNWIQKINEFLPEADRRLDFEKNMVKKFGKEQWMDFQQWVGYTDYKKADVVDTIQDYSFEDCLPGQKMYMVDWDKLSNKIKKDASTKKVEWHFSCPVKKIEPCGDQIQVYSCQGITTVDILIWAAPRPTWSILDPLFKKKDKKQMWSLIKKGVRCQPFIRLYGFPLKTDEERAHQLYPRHTLLPSSNPLGKMIPYGNNLYMISYSDNEKAKKVYTYYKKKDWLKHKSGISWKHTKPFYFDCGTHYFTPLNQEIFSSRIEFLKEAQHPLPNLYLVGEGLSRNQGWTEGAIESVDEILSHFIV